MLRISDKLLFRKIVFGKVGLLVLFVIFVLFARGTWGVYQKADFAKGNRDRAEQELATLHEREVALQEELARLGTERGLEEEIRHKFDVGKESEQLIVLIDTPEPEKVIEFKKPTIWERVVKFLGFR
ncbi:MAG: hypothetical protein JKX80_01220 [Candidatus Pacebacteria bacterium]|nr:hypothetical protein [Candidatus Paceibacterota bacterium]